MTEQTPTPSESTPLPRQATDHMLMRHIEIHGGSWNEAVDFFRREGWTVTTELDKALDRMAKYADERVKNVMAERSEAYDAEKRPPLPMLPTIGFFDADPLADREAADTLKNFGGEGLQPSTVELQQVESTTPAMEPGEPEVHEVPDTSLTVLTLRSREVIHAVQFMGESDELQEWLGSSFSASLEKNGSDYALRVLRRGAITGIAFPLGLGDWISIGKNEGDVTVWSGATDLDQLYEVIPKGMTQTMVPEDAMVFAVPEDFTVQQLFDGIINPRN